MGEELDEFRSAVRDQVVAAGRGPFAGWWARLLELDPQLLREVHLHIEAAERHGAIPELLRHLIWTAADGVVTHLYPRGLGVHARISLELGATPRQVIDALRIAAVISSRGPGRAVPILAEEAARVGVEMRTDADPDRVAEVRRRLQDELGDDVPAWLDLEAGLHPDAADAFLGLAPHGETGGLDPESSAIIAVAVAACPAIADDELTRFTIRRALRLGIAPELLLQAIHLGNTIGVHPISEGIMQLEEPAATAR